MADSSRPVTHAQLATGFEHVTRLRDAVLRLDIGKLQQWGRQLVTVFDNGGRLLAAGNGGSAAEAQHLTSELVGRMRDERRPLSAIALHGDSSSLTAIGNDYGWNESFARQVVAHGRPGDVLILLSTSGRSANLLRAAESGRSAGLTVWAITGEGPNPLTDLCVDAINVPSTDTATVQECHLVAIHLLCASVDAQLAPGEPLPQEPVADSPSLRPLVVVGDTLLDQDLTGQVERLSPDGPVPVVDEVVAQRRPGGAGLTALLAAMRDRPVVLVSAFSADERGDELRDTLARHGIDVIDLGMPGPTPVKTRVRAGERTLLMLSEAARDSERVVRPISVAEQAKIRGAAAVVVADYGRGVTHDASIRAALEDTASDVPVVWDPHPRGSDPVPGVQLVTPNAREAAQLTPGLPGTGLQADMDRARALAGSWPVAAVVVTRGADGTVLVDTAGSSPLVVPGIRVPQGEACGAGDCFAATAAGLLADGALLSEAVTGAVEAAGRYVAEGGAEAALASRRTKGSAHQEEDTFSTIDRVRRRGGTIVATGGCFDLLHRGHVTLLEQARRLGDCLIVCVNDDASVRRLKGPDRPVVPATDRAAVLASCSPVDGVVIFAEDTPEDVLRRIRPHLWVKGGDYRIDDLPEAAVLADWGGRAVIVPYLAGRSTTRLIDRVATGANHG